MNAEFRLTGPGTLSSERIHNVLRGMQLDPLLATTLQRSPSREARAWASASRSGFALQPVPTSCFDCNGPLAMHEARRSGPVFFYCEEAPPGTGTVFEKRCAACDITYKAHGFVRNAEAAPPGLQHPAQEPYALGWDHPDWELVSSRTVVSQRLVQRQRITLRLMAAGFAATAGAENFMQGISAHPLEFPFPHLRPARQR